MKKFTLSKSNLHKWRFQSLCTLMALCICSLFANAQNPSANLDQWQKLDQQWENGNANYKHSNYLEDETVPYRAILSNMSPTSVYSIVISYDITAPSSPLKHGIDALNPYNTTIKFDGTDVLPSRIFDGTTVDEGFNNSTSNQFTLFGGTISEVSYTYGDPKQTSVKITFTADAANGILLWGGHLALTNGTYLGAGSVHGSPYHTSIVGMYDADGNPISGSGNQDKTVMVRLSNETPSTCDNLSWDKTEDCLGSEFCFDWGIAGQSYLWTITKNGSPVTVSNNTSDHFCFTPTEAGTYHVCISVNSGEPCCADITVDPLPSVINVTGPAICSGSDAVFTITGTPGAVVTYTITGQATSRTIVLDGTGIGTVTVSNATADQTLTLVSIQNPTTTCSQTLSGSTTVIVNSLPTLGTLSTTPTCKGTSNGTVTLSTSVTEISYELFNCTSNLSAGSKSGTGTALTWTGLAADNYKVVATNTTTQCSSPASSCVSIIGADCSATLTQGFYGNAGGKDCNNKTAIQIMQAAVNAKGGSVKFGNQSLGQAGCKSFTLTSSDLSGSKPSIFVMLPGGTTPSVLGCAPSSCNNTASYSCPASWSGVTIQSSGTGKGSINNVLLAQTMAMFFNLNNTNLGGVKISGNVLTFYNLACGSSTPGTLASTQTIPCSVFNYLTTNYTGAGHPNIGDLYDLANKVLGGVTLNNNATIAASDMNQALNAINVGFDHGKALVNQAISCSSSPLIVRNGGTEVSQFLGDLTLSAYPNPYTNKVNFTFTSPVSGKASLQVFNELGQNVKLVFQGYLQAGQTQTVNFDVPPAMRSMLIYKLQVGDQQLTGKVLQAKE